MSKEYMAPEVKRGLPYSFPADIWSVGIVACKLLGKEPSTYRDH